MGKNYPSIKKKKYTYIPVLKREILNKFKKKAVISKKITKTNSHKE